MTAKSTSTTYGSVAVSIHWITALLIIGPLPDFTTFGVPHGIGAKTARAVRAARRSGLVPSLHQAGRHAPAHVVRAGLETKNRRLQSTAGAGLLGEKPVAVIRQRVPGVAGHCPTGADGSCAASS
jgi:hypothetical protein